LGESGKSENDWGLKLGRNTSTVPHCEYGMKYREIKFEKNQWALCEHYTTIQKRIVRKIEVDIRIDL
jgi:hypothetical protein